MRDLDPYAPPKATLGEDDGEPGPHRKAARTLKLMAWLLIVLDAAVTFAIGYPMYADGRGFGAEAVPFFAITLIGAIIAGILFVTANALNARKGWGRVAGILLAIVMLAGFPIWTIVGIYVLFQLTWAWKKAGERMLVVPTQGE